MANQRLSRRQMIKGAGALSAAGAFAALQDSPLVHAAATHSDEDHAEKDGIIGSWLIASKPDGTHLLYSFMSGGVVIKTRAGSTVIPSSNPLATSTGALHGAWVSTGDRQFSTTTYELRSDKDRNFIGIRTIQDTITLDENPDTFTAAWTFGRLNADGTITHVSGGTLVGTRIKVIPTS